MTLRHQLTRCIDWLIPLLLFVHVVNKAKGSNETTPIVLQPERIK